MFCYRNVSAFTERIALRETANLFLMSKLHEPFLCHSYATKK